ncbi:MAG: kelch repeat-containing protein, partial [Blastocatellia bacterium]
MNKPPFLPSFAIRVEKSNQLTGSTSRRLTLALIAVVVAGLAASSAAPRAALFFTGRSPTPPPPAARLRARVPARPEVTPRKRAAAHQDEATARGRAELNVERRGHAAIALGNGEVLIIGGENERGLVKETELFDLGSRSFSISAALISPRTDAVAIHLADGRVLVLGGRNQTGELRSTEIYDSESNTFTRGPKMFHARAGHTATELADGRILIAGGNARGSAEILDPSTLQFSRVPSRMQSPRSAHSAILLKSGKILIAGGVSTDGGEVGSGEIFDPETLHFSATRNKMQGARTRPALRELPDGKVQVIGGDDARSMEMFNAEGGYFTARAHLVPGDYSRTGIAEVMRAKTQAGLFHKTDRESLKLGRIPFADRSKDRFSMIQDLMSREETLADVLDRSEHTITELPGSGGTLGGVIVTGGISGGGKVLGTMAALESSPATVTTDKTDYQPGDIVIITGTGWQPGEMVDLNVHRDNNQPPDTLYTAVADENGNIMNEEMVVQESDLGVTFLLTATGQTSGFTAQTTFTDSNNFTVTPLSQSVTAGSVNTFVWTLTATNNGNEATTTFTIPAGWTAPQTGAGPGQVTVTGCTSGFTVVGMVITITQSGTGGGDRCGTGQTLTVTYANATAPTPVSPPQTYTFDIDDAVTDPTVTVTAAATFSVTFDATPIADVAGAATVLSVTIGAAPATPVTKAELPKTFSGIASGTNVSYSYISPLAVSASKQYRWLSTAGTGSASGQTLQSGGPFSLTSNSTVTATYKAQFFQTFTHTGLTADATGTVVTVDAATKVFGDLPFSKFVDDGTTVAYAFTNPVTSSVAGKQYRLASVTGPTTGYTVSGANTTTGNYVAQFLQTFTHTGLTADATGTVVTVDAVAKTFADLAFSKFVDVGATVNYAYNNPVTSSVSGKQYRLDSVTGPTTGYIVSGANTITGTYVAQFLQTFTHTGLTADATGTVVTVDAVAKTFADLAFSKFVDVGATVNYAYNNPVTSSVSGKQYRLDSV